MAGFIALVGVFFSLPASAATATFYGTNTGEIGINNASFSTAHNAATGGYVSTGGANVAAYLRPLDSLYYIQRGFVEFDTSSLGAGATITGATLRVMGNGKDTTSSGRAYAPYPSTASNPLTTADYSQVGTTPYATGIADTVWQTSAFNDWILNSAGIAAVTPTGTTRIAIRESNFDVANSAPGSGSAFAGWTNGTAAELVVTYTPAPSPVTPNITISPVDYFWYGNPPIEWNLLGLNGNNNCTAKFETTFYLPLSSGGNVRAFSPRLAKTTPATANGEYDFYFVATTTEPSVTSFPNCTGGACAESEEFNTASLASLPYVSDPNSPDRSAVLNGTQVTVDFGDQLIGNAGDKLWLAVVIDCSSFTGTLANQRLWFRAMFLDGAYADIPVVFPPEENYFMESNGVGITTSTIDGVSVYDINATSTASAQFRCDQFGFFGDPVCNVLVWLFVPNNNAITFFLQKKDALLNKVPFGYFTQVAGAMSQFSNTPGEDENLEFEVWTGVATATVTVVDMTYLETNEQLQPIFALIKTLMAAALGAAVCWWIWHEVTGGDHLT